ncbi:MAG: S41 family peptidase [Verrucomicrobiota bacterium]
MNYFKRVLFYGMLSAVLALPTPGQAEWLKFEDVFSTVRSNLVDVSEADLNQMAIEGFLTQLQPRVLLLTAELMAKNNTNSPLLIKTAVYDNSVGYLRVGRVAEGLAEEITNTLGQLEATNKLKGLVLDMRYAGGLEYGAAGAVADLFLTSERVLLDWGAGSVRSTGKNTRISLPLAVLTNQKTTGAAEALAAILRQADLGLILGSNTAGQAEAYKEVTLTNGLRLLVTTGPVKLGNGVPISGTGVTPDIQVTVSPDEEKAYWEDPYVMLPKRGTRVANAGNFAAPDPQGSPGTNSMTSRRVNEADLVRLQKDGGLESEPGASRSRRTADSDKQVLRDPALARAIDLLKGLAVVRQSRQL